MHKHLDRSGLTDARELALMIVYDVTENGAYANLSLDKNLRASKLSFNDKKLVTELVNGTIRMIKHLDWVLNLFMKKPIDKQNPWLRNILRIAAYQLLFMQRIPDYAAVNSAVELSRQKTSRTLSGVCNGVLRNLIRNREQFDYPQENAMEYLSVYYSQPEWLTDKWLKEFGREITEKIYGYLNQRADLSLRNNVLQGSTEQLIEDLSSEDVKSEAGRFLPEAIKVESLNKSLEELQTFIKGRFYVQNEASMLAAHILDPQPGENILDLCCGVGGKTTHFAEKMKNLGYVEAVDLYAHKIKLLEKNCQRLGLSIVHAQVKDILDTSDTNTVWNRVFLDAPCSGLGVLHRRADARWRKKPEDIAELTSMQKSFLQKAGNAVAPGGILVYSTCTINEEENEAVIHHFLKKNTDYKLESFADLILFMPLDEEDLVSAQNGYLSILPGKYNTDGMFYARLRRSKPSENEYTK